MTSNDIHTRTPPDSRVVSNTTDRASYEAWDDDDDDDDDAAFAPFINTSEGLAKQTNNSTVHVNRADTVHQRLPHNIPQAISASNSFNIDIEQELADLPSDAFESSPPSSPPPERPRNTITISSQPQTPPVTRPNLVAPQSGLRQTTLFGTTRPQDRPVSQLNKRYNHPAPLKPEPPTHHKLDHDALKTWVYPTNLGTIRDYQFNIVSRALFHNLLVALPTGLGKTFIAATVMLNWFRWTTDAQIVFVAPTKPLVSQQVDACFQIAGIPRSKTTMLTGGISPGLRAEEWSHKRVFFMTPQTIVNDLKTGICDPKRLVLLVVDEAHRATGNYSYVEVVKFIRRFNPSFRILALTATPGGTVEAVQEVINGLDIARVEIRTEFSIDIRQYVHSRKIESMVLDNSEEMELIMDLFSKALQPTLNKLNGFNAYWSRDPMQLTAYGLTQARQKWAGSEAGRSANMGVKGMVHRIFAVLASLAHSIDLLKFHGIGPFYHNMVIFRSGQDGSKGGKYEKEILDSDPFRKMMAKLQFWTNNPSFVGHPKLEYLQGIVLKHFVGAGEGQHSTADVTGSTTRVMIFAHFRDSAEEIVRTLKRNEPMIRPHVFVGQAASKGSEGMDQKKQLDIIQKFKAGTFNTLVATSIGEEGLDIGEVDLIVCYDSSASPIRMLQRMGRTGRKRAGNIVLLLMRGKEENSFKQAKDNYEKMQNLIAEGTRFDYHQDRSLRIVPRDVVPAVDKRVIDIPVENTQADLPEPSRKKGRAPKRPAKKFHMPDGVLTGFTTASRLDEDDEDGGEIRPKAKGRRSAPAIILEPVPARSDVFLDKAQSQELARLYAKRTNDAEHDLAPPDLARHPRHQRTLAPTASLAHGRATRHTVGMLRRLHDTDDGRAASLARLAAPASALTVLLSRGTSIIVDAAPTSPPHNTTGPAKRKPGRPAKAKATAKANSTTSTITRAPRRRPPTITTTRHHANDAAEAPTSSPPPSSPRHHLPSQGISLGSDTSGASDNDEPEIPDSSLRDFVADDDEPVVCAATSSPAAAAAASSSSSSSARPPGSAAAGGRYRGRVAAALPGLWSDEEGDDDGGEGGDELPRLSQIVGGGGGGGAGGSKAGGEVRSRRVRRGVVDDSSSE